MAKPRISVAASTYAAAIPTGGAVPRSKRGHRFPLCSQVMIAQAIQLVDQPVIVSPEAGWCSA
jgi:hypothetical protein